MATRAHGNQLHAQGEFSFPREVSSVFREGAGELLNGVVQLSHTAEVAVAWNQAKGHLVAFYFRL